MFNGKVAAIAWQDKKPVHFVTTTCIDAPDTSVQRYNATEHKRLPISCPKAVKTYNQYMGGTDRNDQMTRLQKCRRHYKWPRRLMLKIFMWAAFNSYILMNYVKPHRQQGHRVITFHDFLETLCIELVGKFRQTASIGRPRTSEPARRLVNDGSHMPERRNDSRNHRCRVCSEKYNRAKASDPDAEDKDLPKCKKTVFRCIGYDEYLCIGEEGANCYADWHKKVVYWL